MCPGATSLSSGSTSLHSSSSLIKHLAGCCFDKAEHHASRSGFSAVGLPHEAKRFTFVDCKINVVNGMKRTAFCVEIFFNFFTSNNTLMIIPPLRGISSRLGYCVMILKKN